MPDTIDAPALSKSSGRTNDRLAPVEFIPNEEFESAAAEEFLYTSAGQTIYADHSDAVEEGIDSCGDFELLGNLPLLSQDGEVFLFRKMNYLRFLAERSRCCFEESGSTEERARFHQLVEDAESVRNHIAECNLRLVISIARKFSNSGSDFDELMSEGNEILLKAINKFDFGRGFRFSTYATYSIQRHFYRYTQRVRKRHSVEFRSEAEILCQVPEDEIDPLISEWIREEHRVTELVARMAEKLNEREQRIVAGRFGLNGGTVQTLRQLGSEMGLSKERVRQLQISAVDKLREFFDEIGPQFASVQ